MEMRLKTMARTAVWLFLHSFFKVGGRYVMASAKSFASFSLFLLFSVFYSNIAFANTATSDLASGLLSSSPQRMQVSGQESQTTTARELVFIDSAVADQSVLIDALQRNAELVLMPENEDGIAFIAKTLQQYSNLSAIHIVSHGGAGQLRLGQGELSSQTLSSYAAEINTIRNALSSNGDILLYGCNVSSGAQGEKFISAFAAMTGADIAASSNVTGDFTQGGDWVLESRLGDVQTAMVFNDHEIQYYKGLLAVGVASISGVAEQGQLLTAGISDADGATTSTFSYQWNRGGAAIIGATAASYTLVQADVGSMITVTISYIDDLLNNEIVTSAATAVVANVNDLPGGSVTISGLATEGQILSAQTGTISDADGVGAFNFQWNRGGIGIAGATGSSYLLVQADVGNAITVTVSYIDGGGFSESLTSAPTTAVLNVNNPPVGTVTISGAATEGQILTAQTGTISDADNNGGAISFSYQWNRSGIAIVGANSSTYLLVQADVGNTITVTVSYTDAGSTFESLISAPTTAVLNFNNPPGGSVTISGIATEGQILSAQTGTITDVDGVGAFSFQWNRGGVGIFGANGSSYLLVQADVGSTITVTVSYTDGGFFVENLVSNVVGPVANLNVVGTVSISGTVQEDQILTATVSDVDGVPLSISYQWQANGANIGADSNSYLLTQAEVGKTITVTAIYTDVGNTAENVVSAPTVPVVNVNDPVVGAPTINGIAEQKQVLTADTSAIVDDDGLGAFSYQWVRNNGIVIAAIPGAIGSSYQLVQADVGSTISVTVSYTDDGNTLESVSSAPTAAVSNVNDLPSGKPIIVGAVQQNQILTADTSAITDDDNNGVPIDSFTYQWLRDGEAIVDVEVIDETGEFIGFVAATEPGYTLVQADVDKEITVVVSYTDVTGVPESVTSDPVGPVVNVNDLGVATIVGGATDGTNLTVDVVDVDGIENSSFSYQWLRGATAETVLPIPGETDDNYTIVFTDIGQYIGVIVTYTDDQLTDEVISAIIGAIRPDVPNVTPPPPLGPINATGWFTFVTLDPGSVASAFDTLDNSSLPATSDSTGYLRPGINTITWSATDSAGNVGTAEQVVQIIPIVEVSKLQRSAEGSSVSFTVSLNGDAVVYPVTVPYTVSGTADAGDHDLGLIIPSVIIDAPTTAGELPQSLPINFTTIDDGIAEGMETIVITLGAPVNAVLGLNTVHTLEIVEGNVPPLVSLKATQLQIDAGSGSVTVTATAMDANNDTLTYDWSGSDNAVPNANNSTGNKLTFNPNALAPGFYTLHVEVSDGIEKVASSLLLNVVSNLAALDSELDSDGDGVMDDDNAEGYADEDSDGIANYLDAITVDQVIQLKSGVSSAFIMQTEPGLKLSLGEVAFKASLGGSLVSQEDVTNYSFIDEEDSIDSIDNVGGYFDFIVTGLPITGQSIQVVIPQLTPMPRASVYRKLVPLILSGSSEWQDFVQDANNIVMSAAGEEGYCPPPGDPAYTDGLSEGNWCLQLTIEDGGPNDGDGVANNRVVDPGGVGRLLSSVSVSSSGGGGALHPLVFILSVLILFALRDKKRLLKKVARHS